MQFEDIRSGRGGATEFSAQLGQQMAGHEAALHRLAGREFNVTRTSSSGEVLFDELKLVARPKKTATGQYATDEQTCSRSRATMKSCGGLLRVPHGQQSLSPPTPDALPAAISPAPGASTPPSIKRPRRLAASGRRIRNPQNIRSAPSWARGDRRAFVAREDRTGFCSRLIIRRSNCASWRP